MRLVFGFTWHLLAGLACLLVVASYAGALHPSGDSLAVFRLPLAVIAAVLVIWTGWRKVIRWPVTLVLMAVMAWHGWAASTPSTAPDTRHALYQKNLLFASGDNAALVADIKASGAYFVTLQEVTRRNRAVLEALRKEFPTQHFCPFARVGGVAVLSRFPEVRGQAICAERDGLAAVQVAEPTGPVWVASLHLHWPWPHGQAAHIDRLEPVLRGLTGSVLIGGDFNAVAWSHTVRRIERASGTKRIGHHTTTFQLPRIGMWVGIDHVLSNLPKAASVTTRGRFGSDHLGVLAWFSL